MKRSLIVLAVIVAFQGIGFAQQRERALNMDAQAVMEEMKARDEFGMFRRVQPVKSFAIPAQNWRFPKQTLTIMDEFYSSQIRRNAVQGARVEPELRTAGGPVVQAMPRISVAPPLRLKFQQQTILVPQAQPQVQQLRGTGNFRELKGYEKFLAMQGFDLSSASVYSLGDIWARRSFSKDVQHPLYIPVAPLNKGQAHSFSNGPVQVINFGDISKVPEGGVVVITRDGNKAFLKYGKISGLTHDGLKRGQAIKDGEKVEIWEATVVDIP